MQIYHYGQAFPQKGVKNQTAVLDVLSVLSNALGVLSILRTITTVVVTAYSFILRAILGG